MASLSIEMVMAAGSVPLVNPNANAPGGSMALAAGLNFHARPGDILQGNLVLKTAKKNLTLNSKGIEFYFRGYDHTTITTYFQDRNGQRRSYTSVGGGDLFFINAPPLPQQNEHIFAADQTYRFPFQFQVPPGTPATTVVNFDHEGLQPEEDNFCCAPKQREHRATACIEYEIKALARVSGLFSSNLAAQIEPAVDPIFPIAPLANGLTAASAAQTLNVPDYCCCDCFGFKPIHATATVLKTALTNGETFEVELAIKNESDQLIDQCTLALQDAFTISTFGGPMPQVQRFNTIARSVGAINIPPHSEQTIRHSILVSNMTPDVLTTCVTKTSAILVRMKVKGFRKPIMMRIPLSCPYAAGIVTVSPVPLASPIYPQAPMQQSMGGGGQPQPPPYAQQVGAPIAQYAPAGPGAFSPPASPSYQELASPPPPGQSPHHVGPPGGLIAQQQPDGMLPGAIRA